MTVLTDRLARLLRPNGSAAKLSRPGDLPDTAALLDSDGFLGSTAQLASQLGRGVDEVRAEAAGYVREMAASHNRPVVRAWHAMSAWMVRGFQVVIDDDDLAKLRVLDRDHALIFLISHRSYLDQFSLPPRLTQGGIAPTFGLAGANLNFFPLGTLARRNGFPRTDWPCARLSARWWPAAATWCGRSRAAGHAPASCGHRDTGCCGM
jgi:glycerol-3-phosphate O-acyltransferase